MKEYNVHEVLAILQKYYITDSQQMVARWIREGKIHGIRGDNRKEGYRVSDEELFDFIEELRPGLPKIMEVYEAYIKKLKSDNPEEKTQYEPFGDSQGGKNEWNTKEHQYKNEIVELNQKVKKLENDLTDIQQEKQIIEMDMIEKVEQINETIKENTSLIEENAILAELYGIIDKENNQLKSAICKITQLEEKETNLKIETESLSEEKNNRLTFKDFHSISNEVLSKFEFKLEVNIAEKHLRSIYERIFNDGLIKAEIVRDDRTLQCPYTEKLYKQQKRLIKNAVKHYFENLNEQEQIVEQLDLLTVAND